MKRVFFSDYLGANENILEGYTVAKVSTGINAEETGLIIKLERDVDNVTLGIDIIYNPEHEENETELMISSEYVKYIDGVGQPYAVDADLKRIDEIQQKEGE